MAINFIDSIREEETSEEIKIDPIEFEIIKKPIVVNQPSYGNNYATLKIPSISVELPIYYGKSTSFLKSGIGHDEDSYLPGECGSIILMGHNFSKFLGRLPDAKTGDEIQIVTNYGEFQYYIYDAQIVKETETYKLPIQKEEEILMIYTCWPINNVVYATKRYVVYAK